MTSFFRLVLLILIDVVDGELDGWPPLDSLHPEVEVMGAVFMGTVTGALTATGRCCGRDLLGAVEEDLVIPRESL